MLTFLLNRVTAFVLIYCIRLVNDKAIKNYAVVNDRHCPVIDSNIGLWINELQKGLPLLHIFISVYSFVMIDTSMLALACAGHHWPCWKAPLARLLMDCCFRWESIGGRMDREGDTDCVLCLWPWAQMRFGYGGGRWKDRREGVREVKGMEAWSGVCFWKKVSCVG